MVLFLRKGFLNYKNNLGVKFFLMELWVSFKNVAAVESKICVSGNFRDVSSVELLMNNHQGIKAEIDARNDSFTTCIELGKSLLARKHYASEEVPCSLCTAMGSWGFLTREKPVSPTEE